MTEFKFNINSKGQIRQRESFDLEFKESFHFESIPLYLRSLVGMANNKGGQIIFGIKNSPHDPVGLKTDKFGKCDPKEINEKVSEYFSHEIEWEINVLEYDGRTFGQLAVKENTFKPLICKKNNEKYKLKESAIYYRYRGETKEIGYSELKKLIDSEREKEKLFWMEHIQKISIAGPRNVHVLDAFKGELHTGQTKIILDRALLDKIKFVKEGKFVEKEGSPTFTIKGDVTGIIDSENMISSDEVYPLFMADLCKELNLNTFEVQCLLWKLKIKEDKRFHTEIKTGRTNSTHKYSVRLIEVIQRFLKKPTYLENSLEEYKKAHPASGWKIKKNNKRNSPKLVANL